MMWEYDSYLFKKQTVLKMIEHYFIILNKCIEHPNKKIHELKYLTKKENNLILHQWNQTNINYPKDKTIYHLFQEQVKKTPNIIAVAFEDKKMTYKELNVHANQLARYIRKAYQARTQEALPADSLITLCFDRSLEMIVAILGVLKAGGAYVPIDPSYPVERIKFILEDTKSQIVLTQTHLKDKLTSTIKKISSINNTSNLEQLNSKTLPQLITVNDKSYKKEQKHNLTDYSQSTNLAYVIYTSGSTGKPKGVLVEHSGLVNLIHNQSRLFQVTAQSSVLQFSSLNFDASVWEIFNSLSRGATLWIASDNIRNNPDALLDELKKKFITTVLLPPVLLESMNYHKLPTLKTLIVGGGGVVIRKPWLNGVRAED